ncbi:MAG: radical SAM protein [Gammaproteobacteria bacterium]|nr:MAG: radical SAM protein [Gammaproteobacteria bacterium]
MDEVRFDSRVVGYTLRGSRYLNITNRCTLRCAFCPKFNGEWTVRDYNLRLRGEEPATDDIVVAVGDPDEIDEVVFCGLGEPTLRLYTLIDVAARLRGEVPRVRVNTDGLANLVYGRDVTPDFEDIVQSLSVSLNAQDEATYNRHCRPLLPGAYDAVLDFARRAREFVPEVTLTAIDGLPGVDIDACRKIADDLGVGFRRRVLGVVG